MVGRSVRLGKQKISGPLISSCTIAVDTSQDPPRPHEEDLPTEAARGGQAHRHRLPDRPARSRAEPADARQPAAAGADRAAIHHAVVPEHAGAALQRAAGRALADLAPVRQRDGQDDGRTGLDRARARSQPRPHHQHPADRGRPGAARPVRHRRGRGGEIHAGRHGPRRARTAASAAAHAGADPERRDGTGPGGCARAAPPPTCPAPADPWPATRRAGSTPRRAPRP